MNPKQKLLAVDDEPRNLKILSLSLGTEWDIKTAATGEETLQIVKDFIPDLILLDIMMPGLNGYQVCTKLRELPALDLTKIILVSGKAMVEERLKGYETGANDYITKPFFPEELLAKVKVFMRLTQVERDLRELNNSLETQVKTRTEQLLNAEAKLLQSAKMSALGEMAAGIAHEINTPLATIQLLSEQIITVLDDSTFSQELLKSMSSKIKVTTQRIAKIINGLRTFAREGKNDPRYPTPVFKIIEETLGLCTEGFKMHGIEVKTSSFNPNVIIPCQSTQIIQVILNLLNNSHDAIIDLPEKWIQIQMIENEKEIEIHVIDSGQGIQKDICEKIFQPFFTTKEIGKGTGLGLSISKGIIESHQGTIEVDTKNNNTCFLVRLPKAQVASPQEQD